MLIANPTPRLSTWARGVALLEEARTGRQGPRRGEDSLEAVHEPDAGPKVRASLASEPRRSERERVSGSPRGEAPRMKSMQRLIEADAIDARVREMASEIEATYPQGEEIHLVGVLKGGFLFMADLIRAMSARVTVDFIAVSSYAQSKKSSGEVRLVKDLDSGLEGRNVIIVEDIVDTGLTLTYLQDILRARAPKTLRTACLLSKPSRRVVDVIVDYIGFTIEDRFVVGYGLDYAEKYRNLSYIAVLDEE